MIRFLSRQELDVVAYDACISKSQQSRIYAYSWYLDVVSDDWGVLVEDNYKAVMPIPYMKALKYLNRKKIIQPFLCQQLGIFTEENSEGIESSFFKKFLSLNPKYYCFNSFNRVHGLQMKPNFELDLNKEYENLWRNFRKDRKHRIKQALKSNLHLKEVSQLKPLISIAKKNYEVREYNDKFFKTFENLIQQTYKRGKGRLYVIQKGETILGFSFFVIDSTRMYYLFSAFTEEGKKSQAPSFLINQIIENNCNQNCILDFEGSSIVGIASFFKSFGATEVPYPYYEH